MNAFDQGQEAAREFIRGDGYARETVGNPYIYGMDDYNEWMLGFMDALRAEDLNIVRDGDNTELLLNVLQL